MRATIVAGIGGLIVGHMLWLLAISLATKTLTVNAWVLAVAAGSLLLAVAGVLIGRVYYGRKAFAKAAFLWGLPISPVVFSISVLAVTYL